METREVEVAIIGAGTAGLTARRAALKAGAKSVVMIEGGPYGTTCARVGCMPSKLLIAAADAAHAIDHAEEFGVRAKLERVDGEAVMKRLRALRDRFAGGVVSDVEAMPAEQKIRGWARFVEPTLLEVDLEGAADTQLRVRAKAVVIAAGTRPHIPPPLRGFDDRVITSDEVFELPTLPRSIAVIGTGVIGLELGQALARLGVRTRAFNLSKRVGPLHDPELQSLSRELIGDTLPLELGISDLQADRSDEGLRLRWRDQDGEAREESFEYVLAATGRRPDFERLGLDALDLARDEGGRPRFDHRTMQIPDQPIFIAGDVNQERSLLHEAADEGRIAGENAAHFPEVRARRRRTPLAIVFTAPNIASVGASVAELDPKTHAVGEVDYARQGRARVMGENHGKVKIWGSLECGQLVAAEMIGPRVEHTAHLLAWAIQSGMTVDDALAMPFYHPVIEEGIRTALQSLSRAIQHGGGRVNCSPGI